MKLSVKVEGMTEILKKLKNVPAEIKSEVKGVLRRGADVWVRNAIASAPADVATLRRGISYKDISVGSSFGFAVSSNAEYSAYIEFGTKKRFKRVPGIDSSVFISTGGAKGTGFYDNILAWVKRKGFAALKTKSGRASKSLDSQMAQEQAAFAIYLSIMRHGIKPHPYFFPQIPIVKQTIEHGLSALKRDRKL